MFARELLTPAEAASRARVDRSTIYRLIRTGQLRAFRIGTRTLRVAADDLDDIIQPTTAGVGRG